MGSLYVAIVTLSLWSYVNCEYKYPFLDPTLSWDERVDDLVGRLTVDEMTQQMARGSRRVYAPGIDRLGIKPYRWGAECLRGDVGAGEATSFPQSIGLAATFSPQAIFNMSRATGQEVRAKYNNNSYQEDYNKLTSASCWSPVINIMRDPRWGRNQETYGEDPYMSGLLSQAFVFGLQGDHPRYIMANAGCKHFDVYGGPENIPVSRFSFNAEVSERDWRMTFLPAFKKCVEAGTYSLMCSFNSINGVPACANKKLLTDILRGEWGFRGYVISDEGAIENIMTAQNYTNTTVDTAAAAVNAGCNLEDGPKDPPTMFNYISEAVKQGKLSEQMVRNSVKPLFYTRMRLGLFDPAEMNPYSKLQPEDFVQSTEHRELAIQLATRSFVLLKNTNNFMPLPKGKTFNKAAIIGPLADNITSIFGAYAPFADPKYIKTPLQGLKSIASNISYTAGCQNNDPKCEDIDENAIKTAVQGSEIVIVCLGTGKSCESEGNDRENIDLPGKQMELLMNAVHQANSAPVVLLLFNAGPLDVIWAQQNPQVPVIMECFFPAQAAGEALWRVFYNEGPGANPAGRLPATWPANINQIPCMTNYSMEGRTYRYFNGDPLYPFGYGLSYSTYHYHTLDVRPAQVRYTDDVIIEVYVQNTSPLDGEEVVQVYVQWAQPTLPVPKLQLVGFGRYFLPAGQGRTCQFKVTREQLAVWDDQKGFVTLPGLMKVFAGGQQPGQKMAAPSNILTGSFTIL